MANIARCLRQIQAVRDVASGIEPAYVARSRIGRLCDSTNSLVTRTLRLSRRTQPGQVSTDGIPSRELREVAESCNRILGLSRHIRQPSEPLDERWRQGWADLRVEVDLLEKRLTVLRRTTT